MANEAPGVQPDNATATTGAAGTGQEAATESDWRAAFSEDNRKTIDAKGWKTADDVLKSYADMERAYTDTRQKALTLPGQDAKPEDWDKFYARVGRPEKPEGYQFKLPEGLPEAFPYDDTSAKKFQNWAHKAGLSPTQAQSLHDEFVRDMASSLTAVDAESQKATAAAHEALVKAWGDPESESYKRNVSLADRAIRQLGGQELLSELKTNGVLSKDGAVKSPRLAQALAKVGGELYAEDALYGGFSGVENPFSNKTENLTQQGQIIRSDPDRARALIRNAGMNPKDWGL